MKSSQSDGRTVSEGTIKKILDVYGAKRWHEICGEKLKVQVKPSKGSKKLTALEICKLGKELMTSISKKYVTISCKNDSEERWLHFTAQDPFVYKEGKKAPTFSDKVDSMAVLIHNNCVFNWRMLSELMKLVKSDKIRVKTKCMELMYSSFMEVLPVRKLRYLDQQEENCLEILRLKLAGFWSDPKRNWDELEFEVLNLLLAVTFEDFLKGLYSTFIQELSDLMNRGPEFLQKNASNLVLQMLIQKPEQEEILLDLIICRLGHRDNKMSSYVFKMLDTLLLNHEKMKVVVVQKILSQITSLATRLKNELIFSNKKVLANEEHRRRKRRRGSYIGPETVHVLKNVYLCMLYISKLHYNKNDAKIVDVLLNNSINFLLMFISTNNINNDKNTNTNSGKNRFKSNLKGDIKTKSEGDENSGRSARPPRGVDLSEFEECNRIIKILLLFLNKLLNYYKKFEKYEDKKNLLHSKLSPSLYHFSTKTQSVSIRILVLSLLYHWASSQERYQELLQSSLLDMKLYESTNLWQFLSLVKRMLETEGADNMVLAKRLIQMSLVNSNDGVNSAIIEIVSANCQDLSFQDRNQLWELSLHRASCNPQIASTATENSAVGDSLNRGTNKKNKKAKAKGKEGMMGKDRTKLSSEEFDRLRGESSLYGQLSVFSGCVQPEYTLERYWRRTNRRCEPHQRAFQLFFECKRNLSTEEDTESEDSEEFDEIGEDEELDFDRDSELDSDEAGEADSIGDGQSDLEEDEGEEVHTDEEDEEEENLISEELSDFEEEGQPTDSDDLESEPTENGSENDA